ncbi:hypothetical protein [Enterovibrio norvegicus]|uniref:hypothetical protein n=1 Tax=Enterovibrio norvegicus TaxID=188144 RepID=UPI0035538BDC
MIKNNLLVIVMIFFSFYVNAEVYSAEGYVDFIRTHDTSTAGSDADWIALKDVTSLGNCRMHGGSTMIRLRKDMDRAYSAALAAQMAGKMIVVGVDDNLKDESGACWLRWLNVKN